MPEATVHGYLFKPTLPRIWNLVFDFDNIVCLPGFGISIIIMTWVFGWPLYNDDALIIAKTHNLVKSDPNARDDRRIQAAHQWVLDQIGIVPVLSCWVNDVPEVVYAVYVDYGDNRYPPTDLIRENMTMTGKQYRRLKKAMPLKDFGWYQHNDPSCELYGELVDKDEDDSDEGSDEGSDTDGDGEDDVDDTSMNTANDEEDAAGSDNETVTDGVVSRLDSPSESDSCPSRVTHSLPTYFDTRCTITEPQP
ncbi:uncharacterized protein B0H18DRAFT_954502 [Fomitopsis serialis]|uniref:uncharacterized protein n=1 Tax=Fomitopsis serialis TaxID=139415 RepID=UPI002008CD0F|nr:uncharacterized protein B0H18DRAFT_954502 [Neoantrodia serialis]KAH9926890.1 hypothetical protein B0H18DRAFT_954502 [Neoantrodia serialis]